VDKSLSFSHVRSALLRLGPCPKRRILAHMQRLKAQDLAQPSQRVAVFLKTGTTMLNSWACRTARTLGPLPADRPQLNLFAGLRRFCFSFGWP